MINCGCATAHKSMIFSFVRKPQKYSWCSCKGLPKEAEGSIDRFVRRSSTVIFVGLFGLFGCLVVCSFISALAHSSIRSIRFICFICFIHSFINSCVHSYASGCDNHQLTDPGHSVSAMKGVVMGEDGLVRTLDLERAGD